MAARFKKSKPQTAPPKPVDPWSIQQILPSGLATYGEETGMKALQNYAKDLSADQMTNYKASQKPQPKMGMLDKGSSKLWAVLSGLGGMLKQDVNMLKSDPIGSLKATADSWTVGQEARDRFKQGDYAGAIINSGAGGMAALPELQNIISGKGKPADLAWLAATYGLGPVSKAAKTGKAAVKTGSTKAYIDILNRLPKP
jgi:uncharacterized protein RhaS with RHS repeats